MKLDETQKSVVLGLAKNNMNVSKTAREIHYTIQGILYQSEKMKRKLGLDPRQFYELCELLEMAKG